jgi:hypothetical protein
MSYHELELLSDIRNDLRVIRQHVEGDAITPEIRELVREISLKSKHIARVTSALAEPFNQPENKS